jgi:hypothetical protein
VNVSNVGSASSNVSGPPTAGTGAAARGTVSLVALLAVLVSLVLGALGCQNDTGCAEDGTPCGGDPTGTWTLSGACRDPAFAAPIQSTYVGQPVAQARQPVAPTTSSDWCSAVAVNAQGLSSFVFPHDTLAVSGADSQIAYAGDGTYQAVIHTAGKGGIDLSASCLQRFGVAVTCDALAAQLAAYAARQLTVPSFTCTDSPDEPGSCSYYYTYSDIQCSDNGNQGCACRYGVNFAGTFAGKWSTSGTQLIHFDAKKMLPTQADYCVGGGGSTLSLWGHARASLFDEPGLRTLKLQRMP